MGSADSQSFSSCISISAAARPFEGCRYLFGWAFLLQVETQTKADTGERAQEVPGMTPRTPAGMLVLSAAFFGVAPSGTKYALGGFGPVTAMLVELLAATALLWIVLVRRGYRRLLDRRRVICLGLLEPGLAYLLFSFGLDDDRVDGPNEKFDLASFRHAARAHARLLLGWAEDGVPGKEGAP